MFEKKNMNLLSVAQVSVEIAEAILNGELNHAAFCIKRIQRVIQKRPNLHGHGTILPLQQ
jgi:hypothetical protein